MPFEDAAAVRAILTSYKTVDIDYETGEDARFRGAGWSLRAVAYDAPRYAGAANLVKVALSAGQESSPNDLVRAWNTGYHDTQLGSQPELPEQLDRLTRILVARVAGKGFALENPRCMSNAIGELTRFASTYRKMNGHLDENLCELMCRLSIAQPDAGLRQLLVVAQEALQDLDKNAFAKVSVAPR